MSRNLQYSEDQKLEALLTPFHEILKYGKSTIYLGNQTFAGVPPDHWNYCDDDYNKMKSELDNLKIKTIICCASGINPKFSNDFNYCMIDASDSKEFDIGQFFDKTADYIKEKSTEGNIFIHCNAGASRSPTILIAFMIKYCNLSTESSLDLIMQKRSCVNIDNFIDQLKKYEIKLSTC